jgi:hypothetical protein
MTAGVLNLNVDDSDPYSGQLVNIADLKPGVARYSDAIPIMVNDNPGKVYKKITSVQCDRGLDTAVWFDLNVGGEQIILNGTMRLEDVKDKWIYLGTFEPNVITPVIQSFTLGLCLPEWTNGERCIFTEEFLVEQINDQTIPDNCYNPYGGECPGA